mgnify:CR=1 FL=1|jgi:hypothetical protein
MVGPFGYGITDAAVNPLEWQSNLRQQHYKALVQPIRFQLPGYHVAVRVRLRLLFPLGSMK